jgi:hypothetical protein
MLEWQRWWWWWRGGYRNVWRDERLHKGTHRNPLRICDYLVHYFILIYRIITQELSASLCKGPGPHHHWACDGNQSRCVVDTFCLRYNYHVSDIPAYLVSSSGEYKVGKAGRQDAGIFKIHHRNAILIVYDEIV